MRSIVYDGYGVLTGHFSLGSHVIGWSAVPFSLNQSAGMLLNESFWCEAAATRPADGGQYLITIYASPKFASPLECPFVIPKLGRNSRTDSTTPSRGAHCVARCLDSDLTEGPTAIVLDAGFP
jgi:hypothetical protein